MTIREELAALKAEVTELRTQRAAILQGCAKAYLLRRRAEAISKRPWWAFWRPDLRAEAIEQYLVAFRAVEDVTFKQAGYPLLKIVSANPTASVNDWTSVTYTWRAEEGGPTTAETPQ